jgi:hypothetical protein
MRHSSLILTNWFLKCNTNARTISKCITTDLIPALLAYEEKKPTN